LELKGEKKIIHFCCAVTFSKWCRRNRKLIL